MKLYSCLFSVLVFAGVPLNSYSQEAPPASSHMAWSNGRISLSAREVPLPQLLDEIRQATNLSLSVFPGAEEEVISVVLKDAPLEQGLRILLGRYDSIFLYSANDRGGADLKKVWVYRKGQATGLEPASAEAIAGTKALREKLNDPDAVVRRRAFDALLARPGIEERELIISAVLTERDDSLRANMLESAHSSGLQLPPEFWASLAGDPSEQVRLLVLNSLEGTMEAQSVAALALTDPSPHVQSRAKEILDSLPSARPPAAQ